MKKKIVSLILTGALVLGNGAVPVPISISDEMTVKAAGSTTERPTTMDESATTTQKPSTTQKPTTVEDTTTTQKPSTTQKPTTGEDATTTQKSSTTQKPTTGENVTTTQKSTTSGSTTTQSHSSTTEKATIEGVEFTRNEDGSIVITGYSGSAKKLDLAKMFEGKNVTEIAGSAFEYANFESVILPNSIKIISSGNYNGAFYGCSNLKEITLPKKLTVLGYGTFSGCSNLKSISLPDGLTTIEDSAFSSCSSLKEITIPDSASTIGERVFSECKSLSSVVWSEKLTTVPKKSFYNCENLRTITNIDGVKEIEENAFYNCGFLEFVIPDNVTTVEESAFSQCTSLTSATLSDNMTIIPSSMFYNCKSLCTIANLDGITEIGQSAFYGCALREVTIPDSVTRLENYVFQDCTSLSSVELPKGMTYIPSSTFSGCSNLTKVSIPETVTRIETSAFYGCSALTNITLPDKLEKIEDSVFRDCTSLSKVETSNGLTEIGKYAFSYCKNLKTLKLSEQCEVISERAFAYSGIENIALPESLKTIQQSAFYSVPMKNVTIPKSVLSIQSSAFNSLKLASFEGNPVILDNAVSAKFFYGNADADLVIAYAEKNDIIFNRLAEKLEISKAFSKTNYCYYDTLSYEDMVKDGVKVTAVFTDGTSQEYDISDCDVTIEGTDTDNRINKVGKLPVEIVYGGAKAGFEITSYYDLSGKTYSWSDSYYISIECEDVTYTGSEVTPKLTVTNTITKEELTEGKDYTLTCSNNINVTSSNNQAQAVLTGIGDYRGSRTIDYSIDAKSFASEDISVTVAKAVYNGKEQKPVVTVKDGEKTLVEGTDYECSLYYGYDIVNAGSDKIIVYGRGNYTGSKEETFTINPKPITDKDIVMDEIPAETYTGYELTPSISMTLMGEDGYAIEKLDNNDYSIKVKNNINAGTATVSITGTGNYTGTMEKTFTVNPIPLDDEDIYVSLQGEYTYTGGKIVPDVKISFLQSSSLKTVILTKDTDYTVICDSVNAGKGKVTIEGTGNYGGKLEKEFTIKPKSITSAEVTSLTDYVCTGEAITPDVEVTLDSAKLVKGTDYDISYENNTMPGTAKVIITGKGNYEGTLSKSFKIQSIDISNDAKVTLDKNEYMYDGTAHEPGVTVTYGDKVLEKGKDYTVSYSYNKSAGTAYVLVTPCGMYSGYINSIPFDIKRVNISDANVQMVSDVKYTGEAILLKPVVMLGETKLYEYYDYTLSYKDNVKVGTATVTITGSGNYIGTLTKTFNIIGETAATTQSSSGNATGNAKPNATGDAQPEKPDTTTTQSAATTTSTVATTQTKPATTSATSTTQISATTTSAAATTQTKPATTSAASTTQISATTTSAAATTQSKPATTSAVSTTQTSATTTSAAATTQSKPATTSAASTTQTSPATTQSSSVTTTQMKPVTTEQKPSVTTTEATHVTTEQNSSSVTTQQNPATSEEVTTGQSATTEKESVTTKQEPTTQAPAVQEPTTQVPATQSPETTQAPGTQAPAAKQKITSNSVTMNETVIFRNKLDLDLEVTVDGETLEEKTDYTVKYSNTDKIGLASVTVQGCGEYTGKVSKTFIIVPAKLKTFSVKAKKGRKIVIGWKKVSGVSGYEVTLSADKRFKTDKTVKLTKAASCTIKKWNKKKCYVRIRGYVKVKGKKYYGSYSSIKVTKTKK